MRFFAGLLAYLVGVSAILSIGIIGLMALRSPTEQTSSAPAVAVELRKEHLAKPVKQTIVGHQKEAHKNLQTALPDRKRKTVHATRNRTLEMPDVDHSAYGYAAESRRINPNQFQFFGR